MRSALIEWNFRKGQPTFEPGKQAVLQDELKYLRHVELSEPKNM